MQLSDATNATIADAEGQGTITDDDGTPTLSVDDVSVTEGGTAVFTVTLSAALGQGGELLVEDGGGQHRGGAPGRATDYTAVTAATATIAAGGLTATLEVETTQDAIDEHDETFLVQLSDAANATFSDGGDEGVGTITDNDDATAVASVAAPAAAVAEGNDPGDDDEYELPGEPVGGLGEGGHRHLHADRDGRGARGLRRAGPAERERAGRFPPRPTS